MCEILGIYLMENLRYIVDQNLFFRMQSSPKLKARVQGFQNAVTVIVYVLTAVASVQPLSLNFCVG